MTATGVPIFVVDAFTDRPFAGNPAAVCLLDAARDAGWMQAVASEMNLSETAYLVPEGDGFGLRWFTPAIEVAICGHATLASAHVLWEIGRVAADQGAIRFHTRSGTLTAERRGDDIVLDFPGYPSEPVELPRDVARALPVKPVHVTRVTGDRMGGPTLVIELASVAELRALKPALDGLRHPEAPGLIVTTRADSSADLPACHFVSRCFFPSGGIDEDPATGSAHCALALYWSERLGRADLVGYQASRRGAVIGVRVAGERVELIGRAVTVLRGSLLG